MCGVLVFGPINASECDECEEVEGERVGAKRCMDFVRDTCVHCRANTRAPFIDACRSFSNFLSCRTRVSTQTKTMPGIMANATDRNSN